LRVHFADWPVMIRPALKVNVMKKEIVFEVEELERQRQGGGKSYLEFLRLPAMSAGVYTLPAGSTDLQKPHKEDEMYYVVRGRAIMKVGLEDRTISAGSVIFVAATVEHRFYDIQEELVVLVFFAPAES
jgi:mannose-6-phosphate isomerase-like protein (cupin superfamily)